MDDCDTQVSFIEDGKMHYCDACTVLVAANAAEFWEKFDKAVDTVTGSR